jgi:hypothetical protein
VSPDRETREEFRAALAARRELGEELEPDVIDAFVERIERRIDERIRAQLPARHDRRPDFALAVVSLCVSIPLIAIAGGTVGLPGVIAVCVAIVLVNAVFRR